MVVVRCKVWVKVRFKTFQKAWNVSWRNTFSNSFCRLNMFFMESDFHLLKKAATNKIRFIFKRAKVLWKKCIIIKNRKNSKRLHKVSQKIVLLRIFEGNYHLNIFCSSNKDTLLQSSKMHDSSLLSGFKKFRVGVLMLPT